MFEDLLGEEPDLAWCAGLFDGEGSTTEGKGYLQVRVPQAGGPESPPGVLVRFDEAMGGVGSIGGPYAPRRPGLLHQWTYTATGPRAGQVLVALWPDLGVVKREQAAQAIINSRGSQLNLQDRFALGRSTELLPTPLSAIGLRVDRRRRAGPSGARIGVQPDLGELAWAAGFFDGEGSTFNQHKRRYPKISISQNGTLDRPPEVLIRFHRAVLSIGDLDGPIRDQERIKWHYVAHGHDLVQAVVALLWRWLGDVKRSQASTALRTHRAQGIPLRRPGQRRGGPLKTVCKRGHNYSDVVIDREGRRTCRPCRNLLARERMQQLRVAYSAIRAGVAVAWPRVQHGEQRTRLVRQCKRGHDPTDVVIASVGQPECRPCKNLRQRDAWAKRTSSDQRRR